MGVKKLRLNLECPYCGKEHTHLVDVGIPEEPKEEEVIEAVTVDAD